MSKQDKDAIEWVFDDYEILANRPDKMEPARRALAALLASDAELRAIVKDWQDNGGRHVPPLIEASAARLRGEKGAGR